MKKLSNNCFDLNLTMKFISVFTCLLSLAFSQTDALVKQYGQTDGFKYIGRALASPDNGFENYATEIVNFPEVFNSDKKN